MSTGKARNVGTSSFVSPGLCNACRGGHVWYIYTGWVLGWIKTPPSAGGIRAGHPSTTYTCVSEKGVTPSCCRTVEMSHPAWFPIWSLSRAQGLWTLSIFTLIYFVFPRMRRVRFATTVWRSPACPAAQHARISIKNTQSLIVFTMSLVFIGCLSFVQTRVQKKCDRKTLLRRAEVPPKHGQGRRNRTLALK